MQITFTIPDDKVQRVLDAMVGIYPPPPGVAPAQWAKQQMRLFVMRTVRRHEHRVAMDQVREDIGLDESLIT